MVEVVEMVLGAGIIIVVGIIINGGKLSWTSSIWGRSIWLLLR